MAILVKRAAITAGLLVFGMWLVFYTFKDHRATLDIFDYTMEDAQRLKNFPRAQYEIAYRLWFQNRTDDALKLFKRTVTSDMYRMDAWLKMGEIENTRGNIEKAKKILEFTDRLTLNVYRWKWLQALLALELGEKKIFLRNINYLLPFDKDRQNALLVLDEEHKNNAQHVLDALKPENYLFYLNWLMQNQRLDDAQIAWKALVKTGQNDPNIQDGYIHFLVSNRRIRSAKEIWKKPGMTNPDFEDEMTSRGFNWHFQNPEKGSWGIKRTLLMEGGFGYILQISFTGKENLNFHHLYQIIPVDPGASYRISYKWRSRNLTTDQRPYMEVYGFECTGLHAKGSMIPESSRWHEVSIPFDVPRECEAVVARLRREPSRRFDSRINGEMALDEFKMINHRK